MWCADLPETELMERKDTGRRGQSVGQKTEREGPQVGYSDKCFWAQGGPAPATATRVKDGKVTSTL